MELTKIKVIDNVYYDTYNEPEPGEQWARASTTESHSIIGIEVTTEKYSTLECAFPVEFNTPYYLLYYNSDGDSFGTDSGKIEFVGLYRDGALAARCAAVINAITKNEFGVTIWDDNGTEYRESINNDYFGGMDGADVEIVYRKR